MSAEFRYYVRVIRGLKHVHQFKTVEIIEFFHDLNFIFEEEKLNFVFYRFHVQNLDSHYFTCFVIFSFKNIRGKTFSYIFWELVRIMFDYFSWDHYFRILAEFHKRLFILI